MPEMGRQRVQTATVLGPREENMQELPQDGGGEDADEDSIRRAPGGREPAQCDCKVPVKQSRSAEGRERKSEETVDRPRVDCGLEMLRRPCVDCGRKTGCYCHDSHGGVVVPSAQTAMQNLRLPPEHVPLLPRSALGPVLRVGVLMLSNL